MELSDISLNRCLSELIESQARRDAGAPAISAPGRGALSYGRLADMISGVHAVLRASGLGKEARVAVVLDNGPHLAVALLGVLASAVAAPLNPGYSAAEFEFYLSDLKANALLTRKGLDSRAAEATGKLGVPVLWLSPEDNTAAGAFALEPLPAADLSEDGFGRPEDLALLLHTSGTTSRPKLVPLTQANICSSAKNISASLELGTSDRYLNVMPLFHVHGMIGGLLSSLAAGSHIYCAPGFDPVAFFDWLEEFGPTWYTAVPTMHQALLAQARSRGKAAEKRPLRFIRSCSAALPPAVLEALESTFMVPVVEAYGMTEASHQMSINPLPPAVRKPGSVGMPTGVALAVLDGQGNQLPSGVCGEVAIRGTTVTSGYAGNPEANRQSFTGGWFRTGDQGYLDEDGYLFLTGRIKEIINRGGEKISPREVDEVLLSHPAVAQAVAFAVPHPKLGEDIAAAVVLRPGSLVTDKDIREFATAKLAHFKVPRRVVFLKDIPKGPTGKLQRIGLAKTLGLETDSGGPARKPREEAGSRSGMTGRLAGLFEHFLETRGDIGIDDSFFDLGGDSLQATRLLAEIERIWGARISYLSMLHDPTVRGLADVIWGTKEAARSTVVPVSPQGVSPPMFLVHPHDGNVFLFTKLANHLKPDIPMFAFQSPDAGWLSPAPGRIEEIAERYCRDLEKALPEGRYFLGGYCFGAWIALEMAERMRLRGRPPERLLLLDGYAPGYPQSKPGSGPVLRAWYSWLDRFRRFQSFLSYVLGMSRGKKAPYLLGSAKNLFRVPLRPHGRTSPALGPGLALPGRETDDDWRYRPPEYPGRAALFPPTRLPLGFKKNPRLGWDSAIKGGLDVIEVPGYHRTLIFEPGVRALGLRLKNYLTKPRKT